MRKLGLEPVPGSGSGWVNKEDGESNIYMAQLKSTDKNSFTIKREDIDKLEYHSMVAHKVPIFVNEFLEDKELYITINLKDIHILPNGYMIIGASQSPSDELKDNGNIIYQLNTKDASEMEPGSLDNMPDIGVIPNHKKVISGNRNKYNQIREKELEKANANYKANKRKLSLSRKNS